MSAELSQSLYVRRTRVPVYPPRWIRARRGAARSTQHVVARIISGWRGHGWSTPALCGADVGNGSMQSTARRARAGSDPVATSRLPLGPKTRRPLVTIRPDDSLPICAKCTERLDRFMAQKAAAERSASVWQHAPWWVA